MLTSRHITFALLLVLQLICMPVIDGAHGQRAFAQQSSGGEATAERERGIQLYEQGDTDGATKALRAAVKRNKTDADAWHYLGLAYFRSNKLKDARKAFVTAIKLQPGFALAHANLAYTLLDLNSFSDAAGEAQNTLSLDPMNAIAHFVLGAVYLREGATSNALKEAEAALKTRADFAAALLLKTRALIALYASGTPSSKKPASPPSKESREARRALLREAADTLDKYLTLEPNAADAEIWREQLETLRFYANSKDEPGKDEENKIASSASLITRARIISKPEPEYTSDARSARVRGTVTLSAVLGADGKVTRILVLQGLPGGLTEKCVEAARQIRFVPATKNGRPVSQYVRIEYNFNVY